MRKGSKVVFNGIPYVIWEKKGNAVKIYQPDHKYPELTMIVTAIKNVKKA